MAVEISPGYVISDVYGARLTTVLPNGTRIIVLKNSNTNNGTALYFYRSTDNGNTWTKFYDLVATTRSITIAPKSDNTVLVVYSPTSNVIYLNLAVDGTVLKTSTIYTEINGGNHTTAIQGSDGVIHIAFMSQIGANLFYAKSTDQGTTWATSSTGLALVDPEIGLRSDLNPVIVGRAAGPSILSTYFNGTSWTPLVTIHNANYAEAVSRKASMVVKRSGSNIGRIWTSFSAWSGGFTYITNLYAAYSDNGGASWTKIQVTSGTNLSDASNFIVELPSGDVYIVYYGGQAQAFLYRKIANGTTTIGSAVNITPIIVGGVSYGEMYGVTPTISVLYTNTSYVSLFEKVDVNTIPNLPTISNPTGNGYVVNQRPKVTFSGTDPDGSAMVYEVQVAADAGFSSVLYTKGSSTHTSEFSPQPTAPSGASMTWTPPTALAYGTYYIRVRSHDGTAYGNWSATRTLVIQNPTWSNLNIADADYGFRKVWIDELRTKINAIRQARGLSVYTFTDATITTDSTQPRVIHITELRAAIKAVTDSLGVSITWTDPTLTANESVRKGLHIKEIRNAAASA
ncbi:sialidase family protein [Cohnella mopanensis]|uniref:sialidase family protein n=1 Tax=Cohnella mopanensis TaxID=2911966 RepID=UPI001EF7C8DD|nr:sialidase family protein [Cohnella mopanensis]